MLKAISDSLQTNMKPCNGGCKRAVEKNWEEGWWKKY